jgi:hypothetical protein
MSLQRGHLLPNQFGGLNIRENLVPEFFDVNKKGGIPNVMNTIEANIRGQLNAGYNVYYSATPIYSPSGNPYVPLADRPYVPTEILITYGTSTANVRTVTVPNVPMPGT